VLVIGNSFARDWVNVLLLSKFRPDIDISYINYLSNSEDQARRIKEANVIFFVELERSIFTGSYKDTYHIDPAKVWCVGVKSFGVSNGLYYNHRRDNGYHLQRGTLGKAYQLENELLEQQWGGRYIELTKMYADSNGTFPIFTPDGKFISQDCRHLTKAGALYFADLIGSDTDFVLNKHIGDHNNLMIWRISSQ
jgi:hypothetical protein